MRLNIGALTRYSNNCSAQVFQQSLMTLDTGAEKSRRDRAEKNRELSLPKPEYISPDEVLYLTLR